MKKFLLIDGNAVLYRAYHALPPLTNNKGEPVQAVYGFFSMLLSVLSEQKPEYLIISFDRSKPTIRQSMFVGYHANRPATPSDFISQSDLVYDLLDKMNVSVCYIDGYEADDVIGTLSHKIVDKSSDIEVVILTGDRDLLQLVNNRVRVLMPIVGITKTVIFDEAAVEKKYEVTSSQFIDYKALIGDSSDGYPGVSGIGPKTASKLLSQYKTFENLYLHIDELPEKVGKLLAIDAEQAALAKKLATIIIDAPVNFEIEKSACSNFNISMLRNGFSEHGFNSLLNRLDSVFPGKRDKEIKPNIKTLQKPSKPVAEKKEQLELL
jgi:DNA polymerase-1